MQIQADLAEKERVQKAREAAKNTVTAYRKNFKGNMTQEKVDEYISNARITGNNAILLDSTNDIAAMLAGIHQIEELCDEVEKSSDDYIHFQNVIKDTSDVIWDQVRVLTTYKDNLEAIPYDELTENQKAALDEINEAIKLVYTTLESDKWKNMQWNSIVNNSAYSNNVQALKDLAAEAEITADTIREQFPALVQACEEAGLTFDDVVNNLNGSFDRTDGGAVSRYTAQLSNLAEVLTDLQDAYDLLRTAQKEMADGGGLSVDTIADLADAEENYLDYLYEENGVIKLSKEN